MNAVQSHMCSRVEMRSEAVELRPPVLGEEDCSCCRSAWDESRRCCGDVCNVVVDGGSCRRSNHQQKYVPVGTGARSADTVSPQRRFVLSNDAESLNTLSSTAESEVVATVHDSYARQNRVAISSGRRTVSNKSTQNGTRQFGISGAVSDVPGVVETASALTDFRFGLCNENATACVDLDTAEQRRVEGSSDNSAVTSREETSATAPQFVAGATPHIPATVQLPT